MRSTLHTSLTYLKGMGEARAALIGKEMELFNFHDLLLYYPFRYVDKTVFTSIKEIPSKNGYVQLRGKIFAIQIIGGKTSKRITAMLNDGTGSIELVWFNAIAWLQKTLVENQTYLVYGKPVLFNNKFNITHPDIEQINPEELWQPGKLEPVYSIPDKLKAKNITSKVFAKFTHQLVDRLV
ncbi:MAG: OB-fold nucleic acid binding domain-containing protein, partial [Chitinophagales bacterium]